MPKKYVSIYKMSDGRLYFTSNELRATFATGGYYEVKDGHVVPPWMPNSRVFRLYIPTAYG